MHRNDMDPSRNNMPLQFNKDKNKPPMPVTMTRPGEMKEDNMAHNGQRPGMKGIGSAGNMGGNNSNSNMSGMVSMGNMMGPMVEPMGSNPEMMMMNPMFGNMPAGQMQGPMMGGQMAGPGMMGAVPQNMMGPGPGAQNMVGNPQGMMGGGPQGMIGPQQGPGPQGMMGGGPGPQAMMGPHGMMPGGPQAMGMMDPNGPPIKETITLKSCVLLPPPAGVPPRSMREKPPGCKTIFVGGLPEKATEEILGEIFEICGPIERIRLNGKKKFTHIRFQNVEAVEEALFISGYRLKIDGSDDPENTGRIHINYADDREDMYEWECLQRAMAREMRHKQKMEEQRNRSPSPQPIIRYSEHEAVTLLENMKSVENFVKSSQLLITWLERGECNRRTANTFYALVQNVQGNLRHVTAEVQNLNTEFEQYKIQHHAKVQGMMGQVCQVERVLTSAQKQRNWDHFSKAQRKNIVAWQRQAKEMRESHEDSGLREDNLANDDMDLSDDDDMDQKPTSSFAKKRKSDGSSEADSAEGIAENETLKAENNHLKTQMEAFKNEVDTVRQEGKVDSEDKTKQITSLQNALQGMQQQLIAQRASVTVLTQEKEELEKKLTALEISNAAQAATAETNSGAKNQPMPSEPTREEGVVTSSGLNVSDKEARMIGLICCFLNIHPSGATVDYLWSYLSQLMVVRVREVEDLMEKIPSMFQQKIVGMGATIERKWTFIALSTTKSDLGNGKV